jgi:LPXTG-motif cell wall-anchored protein
MSSSVKVPEGARQWVVQPRRRAVLGAIVGITLGATVAASHAVAQVPPSTTSVTCSQSTSGDDDFNLYQGETLTIHLTEGQPINSRFYFQLRTGSAPLTGSPQFIDDDGTWSTTLTFDFLKSFNQSFLYFWVWRTDEFGEPVVGAGVLCNDLSIGLLDQPPPTTSTTVGEVAPSTTVGGVAPSTTVDATGGTATTTVVGGPPATTATLPATGSTSSDAAIIAAVMMLLGGGLLFAARTTRRT